MNTLFKLCEGVKDVFNIISTDKYAMEHKERTEKINKDIKFLGSLCFIVCDVSDKVIKPSVYIPYYRQLSFQNECLKNRFKHKEEESLMMLLMKVFLKILLMKKNIIMELNNVIMKNTFKMILIMLYIIIIIFTKNIK